MTVNLFDGVVQRSWKPIPPPMDRVVPYSMPVTRIIAANSHGGIAVESLQCWPNGFTINVTVFSRNDDGSRDGLYLLTPPFVSTQSTDRNRVGIGIRYSNGLTATTLDRVVRSLDAAHELSLTPTGAHGSGTYCIQSFYVEPLPPSGGVVLIAARWLALGIAEQHIELQGDDLHAAAGQALAMWSGQV